MNKVLITGITGFVGSHLAQLLTNSNMEVIGLKRPLSDIWRCKEFEDKIVWVDLDTEGKWKSSVTKLEPTAIIHCAWIGVESKDRCDWQQQLKNITFLGDLIEIMQSLQLSKFVFVGSQAEYGNVSGRINELSKTNALNAYGSTKLACLELLKTFCNLNEINWIWLRLFSVFGEKEGSAWLIPSIINRMVNEHEMNFTAGEQKYAYLYIQDFAELTMRLLLSNVDSGVYNISSEDVRPIKSLVEQIRKIVNPEFKLNFGALPYRSFQSMHVEGDISKLKSQIGHIEFTDFNKALLNTIAYYTSK